MELPVGREIFYLPIGFKYVRAQYLKVDLINLFLMQTEPLFRLIIIRFLKILKCHRELREKWTVAIIRFDDFLVNVFSSKQYIYVYKPDTIIIVI